MSSFDRKGLEVLGRDECQALLGSVPVARIAITSEALPVVVPVNFVLATLSPAHGMEVVIRSAEGTKLLAAVRHAVVAVEADAIEPTDHSGWSVLVRGISRVIDDPDELARARRLPLRPWADGNADRFIGVRMDMVSGRRILPWHRVSHPA